MRKCVQSIIRFGCLISAFAFVLTTFVACKKDTYSLTKSDAGKPYSDWMESAQGSAKYLDGDTVLISVFLEDPAATWEKDEINLVKNNMKIACDFLKSEGIRYGKDVNLIYDIDEHPDLEYHMRCDKAFGGTTISKGDNERAEEAKKLRKSIYDYIDNNINIGFVMKKYQVNSIGVMVFIDGGADAATAYNYYYGAQKDRYTEVCFINLRWINNNAELKPETYAHEILHIFGAIDLYYTDPMVGATRDFIDHVYKEYPTDIMLGNSREGVNRNNSIEGEITDITAYFLGWKDYIAECSTYPTIKQKYKASFVYSRDRLENKDEYNLPDRIIMEENYRMQKYYKYAMIIIGIVILLDIVWLKMKRKNQKNMQTDTESEEA